MGAPSPRKKKRDHKAVLAGAKPRERSVELCLRGDLMAQLQVLQRRLIKAQAEEQATGGATLDGGETHVLAEQIREVQAEMLANSIDVTFRALVPRRKWRALIAEHPPREDDETDRALGLNQDTFFDAAIRACVVEPDFDDADWDALDEVLSDAEWNTLSNAAWAVNARDVNVPFSQRASRILASSAHESEPPAPGE